MTLVKCLECGSEQDFEDAVGYCERCGRKLPVPHKRGKDSVRQQFVAERRTAEVGTTNAAVTAGVFVAGAAAVVTLVVLVLRSQF
jgi:predicted amidophosphoribosyltransferase